MQITITPVNKVKVVTIDVNALDASNSKDLKAKMAPHITPGALMLLNLSSLKFVDSSGLGSLLHLLRQFQAINGDLKLCGMTKSVRSIFELVRMHKVFEIHLSEEEGVRSFEGAPEPVQQSS